ncbi:MAG: hypothetical protein ACK4NS_10750 [Saprospiraceae bacterium]
MNFSTGAAVLGVSDPHFGISKRGFLRYSHHIPDNQNCRASPFEAPACGGKTNDLNLINK